MVGQPTVVLAGLPDKVKRLQVESAKAVVGQEPAVSVILYALLSRGHCLLVGVPGLAKTLLINVLARTLELNAIYQAI